MPANNFAFKKFLRIAFALTCFASWAYGQSYDSAIQLLFPHERVAFVAPLNDLVADSAGNLYGAEGSLTRNTIYRYSPRRKGGWTRTVIYDGLDNEGFAQTSVIDAAGNLFGTTFTPGGQKNCGIVFELSPAEKGAWTETTLQTFPCSSSMAELGRLISDAEGNLYGTSAVDANIYQLKRAANGTFSYSVIGGPAIFVGAFDHQGNFYGDSGSGLFKMSQNPNGTWTYSTLYIFNPATDGQFTSGLTLDSAGNLFGVNNEGGTKLGGTAFQFSPDGNFSVLFSFDGSGPGGYYPSGIFLAGMGKLAGINYVGDTDGDGNVFALTQGSDGAWHESIIHTFQGADDGANPTGLILNKNSLFGSASTVVFEMTP